MCVDKTVIQSSKHTSKTFYLQYLIFWAHFESDVSKKVIPDILSPIRGRTIQSVLVIRLKRTSRWRIVHHYSIAVHWASLYCYNHKIHYKGIHTIRRYIIACVYTTKRITLRYLLCVYYIKKPSADIWHPISLYLDYEKLNGYIWYRIHHQT